MKIWVTVLLMAGAVLLVLGICAFCLWLERKLPEGDYDERQRMNRVKGCRFSFWITVFYYFVSSMYVTVTDAPSEVSSSLMFAGLAVMLTAYETYCLLTDSAATRWGGHIGSIIAFLVLGVCYLGTSVYRLLAERAFYKSLVGTYASMFFGVCCLFLGIMHLIRYLRRNKE